MDWDKLETFYYVAKAGKIALASKQLKIAQPSLSRTIRILEEQLGVKLFFRSVHGLILTTQGEMLFRIVARMFAEIETAKTLIQEDPHEPKGLLKLATTSEYITFWLSQCASKFLKTYEMMQLTIARIADSNGFDTRVSDVAVRPSIKGQPNLVQTYLTSLSIGIYADKRYLQSTNIPQQLSDLQFHRLLVLGDETGHPCTLADEVLQALEMALYETSAKASTYIPVHSLSALTAMIKSSGGVAILTDDFAAEHSNLVRILPHVNPSPIEVYYIFPKPLANSTRVIALGQFLQQTILKK